MLLPREFSSNSLFPRFYFPFLDEKIINRTARSSTFLSFLVFFSFDKLLFLLWTEIRIVDAEKFLKICLHTFQSSFFFLYSVERDMANIFALDFASSPSFSSCRNIPFPEFPSRHYQRREDALIFQMTFKHVPGSLLDLDSVSSTGIMLLYFVFLHPF